MKIMIKSSTFSLLAFTTFKFGNKCNPIFKKLDRSLSSGKSDALRHTWDEYLKMWLKRYEDLFGITKLTEMHENVLQAQARVQDIQQKRRKVQEDSLSVQNKLQEIQTKLEKVSRGDDMFLSIVTEEHELIKDQKRLQNLLAVYDRTEREEQTALALAINVSQDHEKTYREKNKYLSLITGVIGGFIGVIGSSVNNWRHRKDIKSFASEISNLIKEQNGKPGASLDNDALHNLAKISDTVNGLISPKNELVFENLKNKINEFLIIAQAQDAAFNDVAKNVQLFITNGRTTFTSEEEFYTDIFMKKIMREVEVHVEKRFRSQLYISGLLTTVIVLSSVLLYVINK